MEDQEWFPYKYGEEKIMVWLAELPLVRCCASGVEVYEGGQLKAKWSYPEMLAIREMALEYAILAWRRYSADDSDVKAIHTLKEQDESSKPASAVASPAMADIVAPSNRSSSSFAVFCDEED